MMKKFYVIIFCMIALWPLKSEAKNSGEWELEESVTRLEAFHNKTERLIAKEVYEAGVVSGTYGSRVELTALVMYEPGNEKQKARGFRVDVYLSGKREQTEAIFVDIEEISALSKALAYMINLSSQWVAVRRVHTEITYSTKDKFIIGFNQKGYEWHGFAANGNPDGIVCQFNALEDLRLLQSFVESGLELLLNK